MRIRRVEKPWSAEDTNAVIALLTAAFVDAGYTAPERAREIFTPSRLQDRGSLLLAETEDSTLAGMVMLAGPDSPARQIALAGEAEIHLLAVAEARRGQGMGDRLLAAAEALARERGFQRLVLSTQPTMQAAHRLYEQRGYDRTPLRNHGRFLVYERRLTR
jgi:ribosomal protein S18 acetylase RimI-like enzyme